MSALINRDIVNQFQAAEVAHLEALRQAHDVNLVIQTMMLSGIVPMTEDNVKAYELFLKGSIQAFEEDITSTQAFITQMAKDFGTISRSNAQASA